MSMFWQQVGIPNQIGFGQGVLGNDIVGCLLLSCWCFVASQYSVRLRGARASKLSMTPELPSLTTIMFSLLSGVMYGDPLIVSLEVQHETHAKKLTECTGL
jgi:hypothetical protein